MYARRVFTACFHGDFYLSMADSPWSREVVVREDWVIKASRHLGSFRRRWLVLQHETETGPPLS